MTSVRHLCSTALGILLTLAATPVLAQVCAGLPMSPRQTAVALSAGFPDYGSTYGISASRKLNDAIFLGGAYSFTKMNALDAGPDFGEVSMPSSHSFSVSGGYQILQYQATTGPQFGICPKVGLGYMSQSDLNHYWLPLTIDLGASFDLGERARLAPFVSPYVVIHKTTLGGNATDWENDFGFVVGGNLLFDRYLLGGGFTKVGDADGVFRIQAGLIF